MDPAEILLDADAAEGAVPIIACRTAGLDQALAELPLRQAAWAKANQFKAESGRALVCPDEQGQVAQALLGLGGEEPADPFLPGKLARLLPAGTYSFAGGIADERLAALGWLLEAYEFTRYRTAARNPASLAAPRGVDAQALRSTAAAVTLVRDLINTPANDLGPAELEAAARRVAERHGASFSVTAGEALAAGVPADPCGGGGEQPAAAAYRFHQRRARSAEADAGGQGRHLRHRRPRYQAIRQHAADEEGHGRCCQCPRPRSADHGGAPAGAPQGAHSRQSTTRSPAAPFGRATFSGAARGSPSRSATPMPRAG